MRLIERFLQDELASVSIWNLFWFTQFCIIMGLAIDVSSGMKSQARLQHVADAAAHAGVMDLSPNPDEAEVTALDYGFKNLSWIKDVVTSDDVEVGFWDEEERTFTTENVKFYNAVRVFSNRVNARSNGVDMTFLALARDWSGLEAWDVRAASIAAYADIPKCLSNGLFAGGTMEQTSNNTIVGPYCMYGDTAFKIGQNNLIECGVLLMTPGPANYQNGTPPPEDYDAACNTDYASLTNQQILWQSFVYDKMTLIAEYEYETAKRLLGAFANGERLVADGGTLNDPFGMIPPWLTTSTTVSVPQISNLSKQGRLVAGTMYKVTCDGNINNGQNRIDLEGFVQNVAIFTNCPITVKKDPQLSRERPRKTESGKNAVCDPDNSTCNEVDWLAEIDNDKWDCETSASEFESYSTLLDTTGSGTYKDGTLDNTAEPCGIEPGANGLWDNVLIFTSSNEEQPWQASLDFTNNMQLGRIDGCREGGGVRIYVGGSVQTPSGTIMHGVQFVALGDIQMAAKANGVMGATAFAVGDVKFTANGLMGGCDPTENGSEVVVAARPIAIVD